MILSGKCGIRLEVGIGGGMMMKTLFGAVVGALALGAVLVSYDLGERRVFSRDVAMVPAGYQQMGSPYLVQAGQGGVVAPYGTQFVPQNSYGVVTPAGYAAPQYVSERVTPQPAVRRVSPQRTYASEQVAAPKRSWQKSALLIGGSAAGGAGVGALIGGKKGAGIGALLGGGTAAVYDQIKRH
jgi:hypothetical protein